MSPSDLVLEVARLHLEDFVLHDGATRAVDQHAAELAECEAFLQSGIDALKWLRSAEQFILEAGRRGVLPIGRDTAEAIRAQYEAWLKRCIVADEWAAKVASLGRDPTNLSEFRDAHQFVSAVVASNAILSAIDAPLVGEPMELPLPLLPTGRAGSGAVQIALRRLETIVAQR